MTEQITTHIEDAKERLPQQYRDKPVIAALITAFAGRFQKLEDEINKKSLMQLLDNAEGVQLERLGSIAGILREGENDESYRTLIKAKIVQNLSQGEAERIIQIASFMLGTNNVIYQELYPAAFGICAAGEFRQDQVLKIIESIQKAAVSGVRLDFISCFPDKGFCFSGGVNQTDGFGDKNDSAVGGKMGTLLLPIEIKFSFEGGDPKTKGLGDIFDPMSGGHLKG